MKPEDVIKVQDFCRRKNSELLNPPIHRIQTWHPVPGSTLPDADILVLVRFKNGAIAQGSVEDDGTWILDDGTELSPETQGDTYGTVTHWADATDPTDDQPDAIEVIRRAIKTIPGIRTHGDYYTDAIIADLKKLITEPR